MNRRDDNVSSYSSRINERNAAHDEMNAIKSNIQLEFININIPRLLTVAGAPMTRKHV